MDVKKFGNLVLYIGIALVLASAYFWLQNGKLEDELLSAKADDGLAAVQGIYRRYSAESIVEKDIQRAQDYRNYFGIAGVIVIVVGGGLMASATTGGSSMRECPHCAEPIQAKAKVCRHCQRDVQSIEVA